MKKVALLLVLGCLVVVDSALAQCAMCRTALEQNGELAAGFNRGILFLLSMPYLVFGSIAVAWYRRRRGSDDPAS
ncbi:MAG TPA: hypothetical protein VEK15_02995 [Vicinamibacteria bacterium]|nr:hypothetical protein [Vicinamibacteria bacterium]